MAGGTPKRQVINVTEETEGQRLDLFVTQMVPALTRSQAQKMIQSGQITLAGATRRAKDVVYANDEVWVEIPEPQANTQHSPVQVRLNIVYEDDAVLVIDKPAGLMVHPGAGQSGQTVWDALQAHLGPAHFTSDDFVDIQRPGIVHRLDKDTSGLLVCAKTASAQRHLSEQFAKKTNLREYVTLLDGYMEHAEIIHTSYLGRDPRYRTRFKSLTESEMKELGASEGDGPTFRWSKSTFLRRKTYGKRLTLATVRLHTGRTHQIRLHAKDLRMPVVGDTAYHRPVQLPATFPDDVREQLARVPRQLLHARLLGFTHPVTGAKIAFESSIPEDFRAILALLEKYAAVKP